MTATDPTSATPQAPANETPQEWARRALATNGPIPDHILRDIKHRLHAHQAAS